MSLSNRTRAEMAVSHGILHRKSPDQIIDVLFDDGLLMPDPLEPTRWKQNEEPEWDACDTTVSPAGYEGRVIVEDGDQWEASAGDIRALALALLAAANYAERNQE